MISSTGFSLKLIYSILIFCFFSSYASDDELKVKRDRLNQMVNAEYAFARMAADSGIRSAFLTFFSKEAVIFQPGPVNGYKWHKNRPATSARLSWYPSRAGISNSLDLGWTSGPWEYTPAGKDSAIAFGHFISVWRKEEASKWKVILDWGQSHPKSENMKTTCLEDEIDITSAQQFAMPQLSDLPELINPDLTSVPEIFTSYASGKTMIYPDDIFPIEWKKMNTEVQTFFSNMKLEKIDATYYPESTDIAFQYGSARSGDKKYVFLLIWDIGTDQQWNICIAAFNQI